MDIKVTRSVFTPTATFGKMYVNGQFYGYTCEDTVRDLGPDGKGKVFAKTAIPKGKYRVIQSFSNHFQKYLPEVLNVPFFAGVRIHGGNTPEDSEGCILLGAEGDMKTKIWNCASKIINLVAMLKTAEQKEKIWLEITEQK